jgi:NodT family efflux transporter outer membrane factor (OMF) lipoprotein
MDIPGQWWTLFQSAQLNALIERALKNSPTLQAAQAALRQANEIAAAQRGSYYPSVSGAAESQRQKASGAAFGVPGFPSSYYYNVQTASVNVSYTLDAFGGTRRQVEALQAQAEYQQFALEASYLTLTANIVTAAVNEASLRAQISATEDIARSQQKQLDIIQRRFAAGAASRADVLQQQATLQATLATLPTLRNQLAQQRNQLAAYIGDFPSGYAGGEFNLDSLTMPQDLPVSLPSSSSSNARTYANTRRCCIRPPRRSGSPRPICCRRSRWAEATAKLLRSGRTYSHPPPMCTVSWAPSRSRSSKADSSSTSAAQP